MGGTAPCMTRGTSNEKESKVPEHFRALRMRSDPTQLLVKRAKKVTPTLPTRGCFTVRLRLVSQLAHPCVTQEEVGVCNPSGKQVLFVSANEQHPLSSSAESSCPTERKKYKRKRKRGSYKQVGRHRIPIHSCPPDRSIITSTLPLALPRTTNPSHPASACTPSLFAHAHGTKQNTRSRTTRARSNDTKGVCVCGLQLSA